MGKLAHIGITAAGEILRLRDVADDGLVLAEPLHDELDLRERFRVLADFGLIGLNLGAAEELEQLVVPPLDRLKFIEHVSR